MTVWHAEEFYFTMSWGGYVHDYKKLHLEMVKVEGLLICVQFLLIIFTTRSLATFKKKFLISLRVII